ncbi:hypothetical protein [Paenibacillus sp. Marseille-Q9583]
MLKQSWSDGGSIVINNTLGQSRQMALRFIKGEESTVNKNQQVSGQRRFAGFLVKIALHSYD